MHRTVCEKLTRDPRLGISSASKPSAIHVDRRCARRGAKNHHFCQVMQKSAAIKNKYEFKSTSDFTHSRLNTAVCAKVIPKG